MSTILEFDLSYYAIIGGEGMRRIEGRIVSMVNGESIICIAIKQEHMEKKGDNTQSDHEALLYSHFKQMKE